MGTPPFRVQLIDRETGNLDSTSIRFTYNEDGLRVGKNVNGTTTSYVLHAKNVVHLTQGSNNLHFFYAADGSPAIVEYNGVSYGYVKNLQGDIIGIVNASGAYVVRYAYDAWGKQLSKTGSMADTLGTLNPFRYRGYVYDEETGFYYVSSRYYDSEIGRWINADTTDVLFFPIIILDNTICFPTVTIIQ